MLRNALCALRAISSLLKTIRSSMLRCTWELIAVLRDTPFNFQTRDINHLFTDDIGMKKPASHTIYLHLHGAQIDALEVFSTFFFYRKWDLLFSPHQIKSKHSRNVLRVFLLLHLSDLTRCACNTEQLHLGSILNYFNHVSLEMHLQTNVRILKYSGSRFCFY